MRNRTCDEPAPKAGGDNCTGPDVDVEQCIERNCPGKTVSSLISKKYAY